MMNEAITDDLAEPSTVAGRPLQWVTTPPAGPKATGTPGMIHITEDGTLFVCVAENVWRRGPFRLSDW